MRVESGIKKGEEEMKGEYKKDNGCRDHKQRMWFQGRGLRGSASVVLMAGESMVDEAYYVAENMFNNGSLTDNKINKHGEERATMTRFRFNLKSCLRSGSHGGSSNILTL